MKPLTCNKNHGALTRIEVLAIVAVVALLVIFVLPAANRKAKRLSWRIGCVDNVKQIGLSFRLWANDNDDKYPMSRSTNFGGTLEVASEVWRTFFVMSNKLSLPKLVCPADNRQPAKSWATLSNKNISYFVGLDADETHLGDFLAGDRNLQIDGAAAKPGLLLLRTNSVVGWTHEMHDGGGQVALSDGSVMQFPSARLREVVANSGVTNRLAIP